MTEGANAPRCLTRDVLSEGSNGLLRGRKQDEIGKRRRNFPATSFLPGPPQPLPNIQTIFILSGQTFLTAVCIRATQDFTRTVFIKSNSSHIYIYIYRPSIMTNLRSGTEVSSNNPQPARRHAAPQPTNPDTIRNIRYLRQARRYQRITGDSPATLRQKRRWLHNEHQAGRISGKAFRELSDFYSKRNISKPKNRLPKGSEVSSPALPSQSIQKKKNKKK